MDQSQFTLYNLPDELIFHIFKWCDVQSVINMARTSKRLYRISTDDALWKQIYASEYPSLFPMRELNQNTNYSWYRTFLQEKRLDQLRVLEVCIFFDNYE
jgi:hypothetical protein